MTGILIIDKPQGWTSHDVIAKLRGLLCIRRIGHSGTLDPMATGVLAVFVGRATRAVEFAERDDKEYVAGIRFGLSTDTQDIWGNVTQRCDATVSRDILLTLLPHYTGELQQIPPMYSAVKKDGKRLYELARKGINVERKSRRIRIHELELLEFTRDRCLLRIVCSKGTYIRTLCHDIGEELGTGAVMDSLRRTKSGIFTLDRAVSLSEIEQATDRTQFLKPLDSLFKGLPFLELPSHLEVKHRNGQKLTMSSKPGRYRVYSQSDKSLLSISQIAEHNGVLTLELIKSFYSN